jgi:hypothetical protein
MQEPSPAVEDQDPGSSITLLHVRSLREKHRRSQTGAQVWGNPPEERNLVGAKVGSATFAIQVYGSPQFPIRGEDATQLVV